MEKPYKKLTFLYNNTKYRSTNYSPYFLLFGRNGCLTVDLVFDINTISDIKSNSHPDYVQNWQNVMKELYSKIHQKKETLQTYSKSSMTRNIQLTPRQRVLLKKLSEKGGTEKLRSYWENNIYEIVPCYPELTIYQIKPEDDGNKI